MIGNLFFSFKKKKPNSGSIRLEMQWKCLEAGRSPLYMWQKQDGAEFYLFLILELHVSSYDMYKLSFSRCI